MLVKLHKRARTTVRKWKNRDSVEDRPIMPETLHTTLSQPEEWIVVELRKTLLLPLDDLPAVTREFINPKVSRSSPDRCLRRYGVANLDSLQPHEEDTAKAETKAFRSYEPGFVHADVKYLPQMPDEKGRKYLFVAIDRAGRWVYIEITADKSAASATAFMENLIKKAPFTITEVLTDNGKEFTDRFCAAGAGTPTGQHLFDPVCRRHGIEHRLIKPRHPQTNGMAERFNGRVEDVIDRTGFSSEADLRETLLNYCRIYNHHIPQKNLGHVTPSTAKVPL